MTKLHFITALLVRSARLANVSGLLLGRHFYRPPPPAWNFLNLYHVFLDTSLLNLVKKETAVKTAHHCSWSSTLCPQLPELYTKNSLVFNKTPFSFHGYSNHGPTSWPNQNVKTISSWHTNWSGHTISLDHFITNGKNLTTSKALTFNFVNKIFQYFQEFLAVWQFLSYRCNKYWCYEHDFRVSLFVSTAIIVQFSINSLRRSQDRINIYFIYDLNNDY